MDSKIKINCLLKDEIIYELKLRNIFCPENTLTVDLRKKLRKCINQNVQCDVNNLVGKFSVTNELETLNMKINQCQEQSSEISTESRPINIARLESKTEHIKSRLNNVLKFKLNDVQKGHCENLLKSIKQIEETIVSLNFDRDVLNKTYTQLNESNILEEELSEINLDCNLSIDKVNQGAISNVNIQSKMENNGEEGLHFDYNLYQKLPNPMDKYFTELKECNGLIINELLQFLITLCKIKRETNLADNVIITMLVHKTTGPLQSKLLEFKHASLNVLQSEILKCFVPINMKENLVREHVNRTQRAGEPLAMYIDHVKVYAQVLCCNYTETELVDMIKMGINQQDRINLSLMSNINCFKDLEQACIHSQNVSYCNYAREQHNHRSNIKPFVPRESQNVNSQMGSKKCFNCGRLGHIAKVCYRKPSSKN